MNHRNVGIDEVGWTKQSPVEEGKRTQVKVGRVREPVGEEETSVRS